MDNIIQTGTLLGGCVDRDNVIQTGTVRGGDRDNVI